MKTLKESLLDDIETTMSNGSELVKEIEKETKEFLKAIGAIKTYNKIGVKLRPTDTLRCRLFVPYALKQLGYDANIIKIIISTLDETGNWRINISLCTVEDKSDLKMGNDKPVWEKTVYNEEYLKSSDIVKDLLKPAAKSLDTFKKFLNNMEKWNEQLVGTNLLLK